MASPQMTPVEFVEQNYSALREEIWLLAREKQKYLIPCETEDLTQEDVIFDGNQQSFLITDPSRYHSLNYEIEGRSSTLRRTVWSHFQSYFQASLLTIDSSRKQGLDKLVNSEQQVAYLAQHYPEVRELKPYQLLIINVHHFDWPDPFIAMSTITYEPDTINGIIFNDGLNVECRYQIYSLNPPSNFHHFCREMGLTLQQASLLYKLEEIAAQQRDFFEQSEFDEDFDEWPYINNEKLI